MAQSQHMAQSRGRKYTSVVSWFQQVLLVTALIYMGDVAEGLAATTVSLIPQTGLTYNVVQGASNPPNQTITVSKSSTRQVSLSDSDNASWLSVSPATTSITRSAQLTAAVNIQGLTAGTYNAAITIRVGTWYTATVPVRLVVSPSIQPPPPSTSSVTLAWDGVTGTTISGYRVYVGQVPNQYTQTINVGNVTSSTVSGLTVGQTYYFAVTAYNDAGESPPSSAVSRTIQ